VYILQNLFVKNFKTKLFVADALHFYVSTNLYYDRLLRCKSDFIGKYTTVLLDDYFLLIAI